MKLTDIDLNDKSEVSAAHALLAAILGHAVSDDIPGAPSLNQTTGAMLPAPVLGQPPTASLSQDAAAVFAQPGQLPAGAQPLQDAAAVFGGQQSASPLPGTLAPSTAGVDQSSTAPGGLPGISVGQPIGGQTPAHHIVPAALVPGGAAAAGQPAGPTSLAPPVELDKNGIPWDARIHASTKSKKKDGTWTALRGLNDEAKVKQIEAELRASVAASQGAQLGAIVQAQGAAPLPGNTAAPQTMNPAQLPVTNGPASSAGNAQPGAMSLPGSAQADPVTFEQLMPRVTQATIAGVLPPTALQQVCGLLGLPSVVALQTNPAYVPHAWAQLKAAYPALQ